MHVDNYIFIKMKRHFSRLFILALGAIVSLSACNSSDEETDDVSYTDSATSTLVTSFSLKPNYKLLSNLDSVFFSIDQVKGEIFNADSLPWGTDVRKLTINVGVPSTSAVEVIMPKLSDGTDTIINLLENANDSINFSHGKVWLRVASGDGNYERIYNVKVNVHQCNSDSLQWSSDVYRLPAQPDGLRAQRTAELNETFYSLSMGASELILSTASAPNQTQWENTAVTTLPSDVNVNTFTATSDALYILSDSGALWSSSDGLNWAEVETGWSHIYGAYQADIIGVKGDSWIAYPSGTTGVIDAEMPIKGTSQMWTYVNEWAITPQSLFVGGIKADGNYSGNAWAFDGQSWVRLSNRINERELPEASDYILFPYFTFRVDKGSFFVNNRSAWFALGGITAKGEPQTKLYVSLDNGVNWTIAPKELQLPAAIKPRAAASVILNNRTFSASSRAVKPITEWDAPYIYMFGGYNTTGQIFNELHIGVINRLTFKPLQ